MEIFNFIFVVGVTAIIGSVSAQDKNVKAIAVITGAGVHGNVSFSQTGCTGPVLVQISLVGLKAGDHGFHIHEKGDLSDGCASTGGHYNPDKVDHGAPADEIRHIGDLGNVKAAADGTVVTSYSDSVISLHGARSILGRAVVVHADIDDLGKTDHPDSKKTGNAGGRVGCGVIGLAYPLQDDLPCNGSNHHKATILLSTISFAVLTTFRILSQ